METIDVLRAARERIATPDKWCQQVLGIDAHGNQLMPEDLSRAVQCCAEGAVFLIAGEDDGWSAMYALIDQLKGADSERMAPVSKFNDTHTHAEVLALFDKAIASLALPHAEETPHP